MHGPRRPGHAGSLGPGLRRRPQGLGALGGRRGRHRSRVAGRALTSGAVTREPEQKSSGLSLQTLLISSVSAVVAAVVVPMFWERGSLLATAITPIVVALASEALNRPAKVITDVAPRVTRRSATGAALRSRQPTGVGARGGGPERVGRHPPNWARDA